ncbi:MAG TPA: ATP-binding protein [Candidatus Deferrimicrobium sp.]|nr:ATP-binding protein [Candidatus Deferrimicrobium sp.]
MKILRTLRAQFALIIIIAILIPVSAIGYYAVVYQLAERNFAVDTQRQLTAAARELEPLFQGPGAEMKEEELSKILPAANNILRGYLPVKLSYFNGSSLYTFAPVRGKSKVDSLIINSTGNDNLEEYRTALTKATDIVVKETDGDLPGLKGMEAYLTVGQDKQGLLILDARLVPFFLENRYSRQGVSLSLILGLLFGVVGVLMISHRLQKGITQIQMGLELAACNLDIPLEAQSGELGTLVSSINEMREELVSKRQLEQQLQLTERLAGLGKLTAGVAHEIRNPLGIMKGTIQLMERDIQAEPALNKYREHMQVMQEQIARQNRVVEELLGYAKPVKPRFGPVSISGMIDSVLSFLSPSLRQQGTTLTIEVERDLPAVFGDGEKLKQVLVNLLINSKEALPQKGEIKILARRVQECVEIRVSDNGPGIPQENLARIFEPFFSTKEAGTGLGLSIAKQIVELHNGEINVSSQLGTGTSFVLRIPAGGGNVADNFSN